MKTLLFIAGARPNFIKISALTKAADLYKEQLKIALIHTGQHYDGELSDIFFKEFKMPKPLANLGISSGSLEKQLKRASRSLDLYIKKINPDGIVVVGDVNSTLISAIIAKQNNIPLFHVEAGLRSFNWKMPEEINRVLVDRLSDLLFVTEKSAVENLKNEGIDEEKIFFAGNVMIDTLMHFLPKIDISNVLEIYGLKSKQYALATVHRKENTDNLAILKEIVEALEDIDKKTPVILPIHPRTKKAFESFGIKPQFKIIEPQGYFDFLKLQKDASFILTDSGGIQEEASSLNVPCITMRTETERPVTCELGTNILSGTKKEDILLAINKQNLKKNENRVNIPFWDGKAGERIIKTILNYLS